MNENKAIIECTNVDYFEEYFDLKTDYGLVKQALSGNEILNKAMEYGYGMRILRQNKLETIIGFMISANNNIKRIQNSMNELSQEFGTKINSFLGTYYAFPTLEQLSKVTKEDFVRFGTGYRAGHLVETIEVLNIWNLEELEKLDTPDLLKKFIGLKGIGQKVADCIVLFSYYRTDVVPVDTWVFKIYNKYFNQEKQTVNKSYMRKELTKVFKAYSGYAQQYLFYYERQMSRKLI